jgi:tetratricopeptide (TPR) repeat protein
MSDVDYLERLISQRAFGKALVYAEHLLNNQDNDSRDLLIINHSILHAKYNLGDFEGALAPGEFSVALAKENGEWDYHGSVCLTLGSSYYRLRQVDKAMVWWYQYLEYLSYYSRAAKEEALAWFNLGMGHKSLGDNGKAATAFERGISAANRLKNDRFAHGIRQALIETHIASNNMRDVPKLLSKCAFYLRHNRDTLMSRESHLFHLKLRAEFALATKRFGRATAVALRGLRESEGLFEMQAYFHFLLSQIAYASKENIYALGHVQAARNLSIMCKRSDLESIYTTQLHTILRNNSGIIRNANSYYFSQFS